MIKTKNLSLGNNFIHRNLRNVRVQVVGIRGRAPTISPPAPSVPFTNTYNPYTRKSHSYIKETYLRYVIYIYIVQIVEFIYYMNLKLFEIYFIV